MMPPESLIGPSSAVGLPAPPLFVEVVKTVGFLAHMVPMNLWYAGILTALIWRLFGGHGKEFAHRLFRQMPVIIGLGVNFGVVPLLFLQVGYHQVFYPATIFMAWPWLAVVPLVILAYYAIYYYAYSMGPDGSVGWKQTAAAWIAAGAFICVGFMFANAFSLMAHVAAWPELWQSTSIGAAPTGLALNVADPQLWPRWLYMFGLALTTTSVYLLFDAYWLTSQVSEDYRRWAARRAVSWFALGSVWLVVAGAWYMLGTWPADLRQAMFTGWRFPLTVATIAAPLLPAAVLLHGRFRGADKAVALAAALCQIGLLALNATSRQVYQNLQLAPYFDLRQEPLNIEWSPLVLFLVVAAIGLGVIIWMLRAVVVSRRQYSGPLAPPSLTSDKDLALTNEDVSAAR